MRIKIITISLFFFVAMFISCKKEDLSNINGPGNTSSLKLGKVIIDNVSANEYIYNESGLLREDKSKFEFSMHQYDAKGQLVSSKIYANDDILSADATVCAKAMSAAIWVTPTTGSEDGIITYEYNENGQLLKSVSTRPSSTDEYSVFTYDASNRISKQTMYWDNVATGYIDYAYDSKGNLLTESLYNLSASGTAELSTVTKYTFDTSQNPFKAFNKLQIPGVNTNANNILKETYTIHLTADQGSDKVQVTENSYKYNALGYPVSLNDNITFVYL